MVVTELSGPEGIVAQEVPEARSRRSCSHRCEGKWRLLSGPAHHLRQVSDPPGTAVHSRRGDLGRRGLRAEGSGFAPGDRVLAAAYLGGYAERIAVNPAQVLRIPDGLAFDEAASLIINYQTMEFALARRAKLVAGRQSSCWALQAESERHHPAGQAHGARVIAVVRREGVDDFLRELGADEVVALAPGWGERIRELTDGVGAQIVVDPVGGDAFDDAVRVLAPEGRLV